jgi:hypothetical protein
MHVIVCPCLYVLELQLKIKLGLTEDVAELDAPQFPGNDCAADETKRPVKIPTRIREIRSERVNPKISFEVRIPKTGSNYITEYVGNGYSDCI